jgi:hypothetical protein
MPSAGHLAADPPRAIPGIGGCPSRRSGNPEIRGSDPKDATDGRITGGYAPPVTDDGGA